MIKFIFSCLFALFIFLFTGVAHAQEGGVPRVAVSIKPLHSLVSAVMGKLGTPSLIVKGGGSEHGYALKPSDAELISKADIIFIAHPDMERFLLKPIATLAPNAKLVSLGEARGVTLLDIREGALFSPHHHGQDQDEGHDHEAFDFHFWLDPVNAMAAVHAIADNLAAIDPVHAEQYRDNAMAYNFRLDHLMSRIHARLYQYKDERFIVFHDAYQYFEKRFGLQALGAVAIDPERQPGVMRIDAIRSIVTQNNVACVFSEPQFQSRLVQTIIEGTKARTAILDPLGMDIEPGERLYPALISGLAQSFEGCFKAG